LDQLTFLSEEPPVSPSQLQDSERDWMTRVATSCSPSLRLLADIGPDGWFGRTSPASYHPTEERILPAYFEGWQNSGMGGATESLTLSTGEWPSDGVACFLSDVLETGTLPPRYYLSAQACQGILRRAENRGKELPPALYRALLTVSQAECTKE